MVQVILLADPADLRGDAAAMFGKLPMPAVVVRSSEDLQSERVRISLAADLYLDAILGTGFKPPVSGLYADAIAMLNASQAPVVAVDIPSGADADAMGPQTGIIARADSIVTFTAAAAGACFQCAHRWTDLRGRDRFSARGDRFVSATECDHGPRFRAADRASSGGIEQRELRARVGGWRIGRQGGVGGDGRDVRAASRSGAGDGGDAEVCAADGCRISSGTDDRAFGGNACGDDCSGRRSATLDALVKGKSVLAIGPGISRYSETSELVRTMVSKIDVPIVLDADGLNAFEGRDE